MSSSVASGDNASLSHSVDVPPSPADASTVSSPIEPQNPFESVVSTERSPTVPSLSLSASTETSAVSLMRTPERTSCPAAPVAPDSIGVAAHPTPSPAKSTSVPSPAHHITMPAAGTPASMTGAPAIVGNVPSSSASTGDDDENTAPSSAANTAEHQQPTISRFLENTRRRLSTRRDSEDDGEGYEGALVSGFLQKLGRNGKWQTRWFETDGECLSYYKSSKRSKLLATLDLEKVGAIEIDKQDSQGCSFRIQVLGRLYHLRADSRASCRDWVIMLNRVKEARLQQGNVKLVGKGPRLDLLDNSGATPRVVVVSNRQRTRAVDEEDQWDQLIRVDGGDPSDPSYGGQKRHSALSSAVVGRWTKRHSTLQRLGQKLSKWARSLKKYSCADLERENVFLDRHVHPPGHDDKLKRQAKLAEKQSSLPQVKVSSPKPEHVDRSISTASDYDARMIS